MQPPYLPVIDPSSITFNWRRGKIPATIKLLGRPVALNGKLYVRAKGYSNRPDTILEYTPDDDQWAILPPPLQEFTLATLRGQLLAVGGREVIEKSNKIFTFDERSEKWVQSYSPMPKAVTFPAVAEYQHWLMVAGGRISNGFQILDVNILDTDDDTWKAAQPLPTFEAYCSTVTTNKEDLMYLVGQATKTVLRAYGPALAFGDRSKTWETLPNAPYYHSSPVTIGNNALLTVGGSDKPGGSICTTSIQMYNPSTNQWTKVGDLPEPMVDPFCVIDNSELFVLGNSSLRSIYVSKLNYSYQEISD